MHENQPGGLCNTDDRVVFSEILIQEAWVGVRMSHFFIPPHSRADDC